IWLFANRYLGAFVDEGAVFVEIAIQGLQNRELAPARADVLILPGRQSEEDEFESRHQMPIGELRARHLELAQADALDLFELFDFEAGQDIIADWQNRLLSRQF